MGWMSVENNLILANAKMTHRIIHQNIPEIISQRIKSNFPDPNFSTSNSGEGKIGPRPAKVGRTKITKTHYRSNAYRVYAMLPEVITEIKKPHLFKKWTTRFLKNPNDTPKSKMIAQIQPT